MIMLVPRQAADFFLRTYAAVSQPLLRGVSLSVPFMLLDCGDFTRNSEQVRVLLAHFVGLTSRQPNMLLVDAELCPKFCLHPPSTIYYM